MYRILILAFLGAALTACAATTGTPNAADLGASVYDHAPAGEARAITAYGYELAGPDGWSGRMIYRQDGAEALVAMQVSTADGERHIADLAIAMPYLEGGVRRFSGETQEGRPLAVELQAGPCGAGQGERHLYFAHIALDGHSLTGCGDEVARDDRWSNYLMDYLPAIDTCLTEFRNRNVHVSVAYTMAGGHTGIRIVDEEMRTWECATREEGLAINSLRRVDAADAIYGEGDPIFVRASLPEFGEGCYVYESVREADGTLIGAFGYDACSSAPLPAPRDPGVG